MKTKIAVGIVVVVLLGMFSWFVWPTQYQYIAVGPRLVRVSRINGRAWLLCGGGWKPMQSNTTNPDDSAVAQRDADEKAAAIKRAADAKAVDEAIAACCKDYRASQNKRKLDSIYNKAQGR